MADKKKRYPRATSPVGVAIYPHLTKPDTKFKPEGEYTVRLRFEPVDISSMIETADRLIDEKVQEVLAEKDAKWLKVNKANIKKVSPFKPDLDDEGDETGKLVGNFKMKAEVTKKDGTKFVQRPKLFDAKGKETTASPWSGSELKVNFEFFPYFNEKDKEAGCALRLNAVQIIKLVDGGSGDAASFGFGEEDGFADETATEASTETVSGTPADDSDF